MTELFVGSDLKNLQICDGINSGFFLMKIKICHNLCD